MSILCKNDHLRLLIGVTVIKKQDADWEGLLKIV